MQEALPSIDGYSYGSNFPDAQGWSATTLESQRDDPRQEPAGYLPLPSEKED